MKKIGILTFHYGDGYGAVLQAYALRKVINGFADCNAEIINYVPSYFSYDIYSSKEDAYERMIEKRKKFEDFLTRHCGIHTQMIDCVRDGQYDCYCVGSDQVWNLEWDVYEYFLPNLTSSAKRIAYAASIGLSPNNPRWDNEFFRKYLSKFDAISLREIEYIDVISELSGKQCEHVLDPTLLLTAEYYEPLLEGKREKKDEYILLFWIKHDLEYLRGIEFANQLARKSGLPIIHSFADNPPYLIEHEAGTMIYSSVEDFLWYIKNASYIVTNSYHATLFSIQFKKIFFSFNVGSMNTRISTLKKVLKIDDRIVEDYIPIDEVNLHMDYDCVYENIERQRKKSMDFLKRELLSGEDGAARV